jgi:uncharacterized membrane protein
MAEPRHGLTDTQVETIVGNLLRTGVVLAAIVMAAGAVLFLIAHGSEPADFHTFAPERTDLRDPWAVLTNVADWHSTGLLQLGVLLLIATPVVRVLFSIFAFGAQRDYTYVCFTLIVAAVLLYSLFFGQT